AARSDEQHCNLWVQAVLLAFRTPVVGYPADCITQVHLTAHQIVPGRRERILAVGHEHLRTRVQGVDDHLAIRRSGDLYAAIEEIWRDGRDAPVGFADRAGLGEEIRQLARIQRTLPAFSSREQLMDPGR